MCIGVGDLGDGLGFVRIGEGGGQFLGGFDSEGSKLFDLADEVAGSLVQFLVGLFPRLVGGVQGRSDSS